MKLSQREKQLVWCLINISVLLFGVKWAFPKINYYHQTALEKLQTNETYALEAEILLSKEKELPERLEQYKKELTQEASYYFSKLDPEYMEAWIMGISERYPINIETLNIEAARLQGEEGTMEVLPINMTLKGEEPSIIAFLDALLNDNRHVVVESVQMDGASAQVRMALYRIDKESDPLDDTVFNQPPGKDFLMKQEEIIEPEIEMEVEPELEQVPEENNSNISALEMLLGQLLRPQENGNASNQTSTNGDNQGQDIEETQNKPEIEGDKHEGSAQEGAESAQAETTPSSNS
ncbi:MAG: hypothetical protein H9893_03135 [Candidatus Niameybacter stercoravium]|nr:hypothetical protein [Candidatus Niameybacter stercoravium]